MMEMLSQAAALLKPGEPGLSVIVADIDHFKRINDLHGHASGDQVLMAVAARLREFSGDQQQHNVARWGGEEFLVLLPSTRLANACKRAEQLRHQVGELRIGRDGLRVTLSLGVAELIAGEPLADCLRRCDQALYRAKDAGRDTVVAAQGALFATMS
jgi:diguanylate cyclase (GGDEF)-like protein